MSCKAFQAERSHAIGVPLTRWGEGNRSSLRFAMEEQYCHYILQCSIEHGRCSPRTAL